MMTYEAFKEELLRRLQDFYGKDMDVDICRMNHNNRQSYDGVKIMPKETEHRVTVAPVISIEGFFESYDNGSMKMADCVKEICREREKHGITEELLRLEEHLSDWEAVKGHIYPILLSTKENEEMLKELVSVPMLDLSVAYVIRLGAAEGQKGCIKIKRQMLEQYGIEAAQLHGQAMENLEKDGYEFQDIEAMVRKMLDVELDAEEIGRENGRNVTWDRMYVLTNAAKTYGAAGILNKKLIREFAGEQDFFILPSSIHETIFVCARDLSEKEAYDNMVVEVNETQVDAEERLSDHCYFYDGQTEEIRMCA